MGAVTAATPWKQLLLSALESNSRLKHSTFFQLATVGSDGRPSNRTVVFRGFEENTGKIQINTDYRTRKIDELKQCPFAEICWYFTDSWEQFRINGRVDIIDGEHPDPLKLQVKHEDALWGSDNAKLDVKGCSFSSMQASKSRAKRVKFYINVYDPLKGGYHPTFLGARPNNIETNEIARR
ncbi:pyridoxine/pyridoxamine 5'-phosphate oxidase 2 isoform X2 [Euphorbia lathyris]|uniref:pyridoxine/pyridoxamine 5'-phosphate oxidase 2 isoform X2 n=1 Tax=Euphorbia lathyris TaxID=212925 RepID=UPI0033142D6F